MATPTLDKTESQGCCEKRRQQQTESQHSQLLRIPRRHSTIRDIREEVPRVNYKSFFCGLTAGVVQAGLFNPFDRALYLSVKNNIPLVRYENFQNPYQGFFQSVGHRALSGGMYYPLEQFFMTFIPPEASVVGDSNTGAFHNFLAGIAAGSASALLFNPVSAIKYKTWGREANRGMMNEAIAMLRKGGIRPFCNGLVPTLLRDVAFGGCYTFLRFEIQYRFQLTSDYQWAANFVAAAMATVVSGPFNLARNEQYATKSREIAYSVSEVLTQFRQETMDLPTSTERMKHVQNRLRIGWGTVRVAVGMAFGNYIYDQLAGIYATEEY